MGSIPFAQHNKKSLLRQVKIVGITKKARIADFDLLGLAEELRNSNTCSLSHLPE